MSITLATIRGILNIILGDTITGITSANGNDEKTTLIDVALARYPDRFFEGKTAFLPKTDTEAEEEQMIDGFHSPEGIVTVYAAFTKKIVADRAYEIHLFSPSDKKVAINEALVEAYPFFYNRVEDTTLLTGKGPNDTEYSVPAGFTDDFPDQVWLKTTVGSKISYEEFFDVDYKEISGSKKFYADIPTTKTILLIGKTFLTPLTSEVSTELTTAQAKIVCLKAAAILYGKQTAVVDAENAVRFDVLAGKKELEFQGLVRQKRMPALYHLSVDWEWTE